MTPRQQKAKDRYIRRKHVKDMIQPSHDLFKRYYPKQHGKMEKDAENRRLGKIKAKKDKDKYIKQWRSTQYRHAMKKALKLEEKLEHGQR